MNIIKEFGEHPKYLYDYLVQIYLVYKGGRKACLLETANILTKSKNPDEDMKKMLDLLTRIGLVAVLEDDKFKRYLVGKQDTIEQYLTELKSSDEDTLLGKYLGFLCLGHDYQNGEYIDRLGAHIYIKYNDKMVGGIAYVCEKEKITQEEVQKDLDSKVETFRQILPDGFTVTSEIEIVDSMNTRKEALSKGDLKYIVDHYDEYDNDLYNNWNVEPDYNLPIYKILEKVRDPKEFPNYQEFLTTLWENFVKYIAIYEKDEIDEFNKNIDISDLKSLMDRLNILERSRRQREKRERRREREKEELRIEELRIEREYWERKLRESREKREKWTREGASDSDSE